MKTPQNDLYAPAPRRARASRHRPPLVTVRSVALVVVGLLLAGAAGAGAYFEPVLATAVSVTGSQAISHATNPTPAAGAGAQAPAVPASVSPFTVLLLGSDDDQKFDPNHV